MYCLRQIDSKFLTLFVAGSKLYIRGRLWDEKCHLEKLTFKI